MATILFFGRGVEVLQGEIVTEDAAHLMIEHKKPRSSKYTRTGVPMGKVIRHTLGDEGEYNGMVVYESDHAVIDEITGDITGNDDGTITVLTVDKEGNELEFVVQADKDMQIIGGDVEDEADEAPAKPAGKKGGRAAKAEPEEAPKRGRRAAAAEPEEEEAEEPAEEDEPEEKPAARRGRKSAAAEEAEEDEAPAKRRGGGKSEKADEGKGGKKREPKW